MQKLAIFTHELKFIRVSKIVTEHLQLLTYMNPALIHSYYECSPAADQIYDIAHYLDLSFCMEYLLMPNRLTQKNRDYVYLTIAIQSMRKKS